MAVKGQSTKSSFLPWDSMLLLLQKLERDNRFKFQLLFAVGCFTGLRISDILKLRWSDVLNQDSIELVEGKTKKTRKIRLNPTLVETITRLHGKMDVHDDSQLLFVNKTRTKAINIQYINKELKTIARQYKLPMPDNSISSHLFRKTLGRHVWEVSNYSEKSLLLLGELFNHSSIRITKIYLGLKDDEIGDVYMNL